MTCLQLEALVDLLPTGSPLAEGCSHIILKALAFKALGSLQ